jgi:hypothetical protein
MWSKSSKECFIHDGCVFETKAVFGKSGTKIQYFLENTTALFQKKS